MPGLRDVAIRITTTGSAQATTAFGAIQRSAQAALGTSPTGMAGLSTAAAAGIVGTGLAIGGLATGIAAATQTAADFEQGMANVRAVTGAAGSDFASLTELAKRMGAETQFSAMEAASGIEFLGMAGLNTDQILEALPQTLSLAAAGALDLGMAADIATNIMSGTRQEAKDLGHIVDALAVTASNSNTDVAMLGESFKFSATTATQAGVEFDELAAALGTLGDSALKGSIGGTSLNAALIEMLKPSEDARQVMEDLGIEFKNSDGTLRPLVDIIRELSDAGVTAEQNITLFGARGGRAIGALSGDGGEKLAELKQKILESGGAAEEMGNVKMDTLRGKTKELSAAWEAFKIELGEGFLPISKSVVEFGLTPMLRGATALLEEINPKDFEDPKFLEEYKQRLSEAKDGVTSLTRAAATIPDEFERIAAAVGPALPLGIVTEFTHAIRGIPEEFEYVGRTLPTHVNLIGSGLEDLNLAVEGTVEPLKAEIRGIGFEAGNLPDEFKNMTIKTEEEFKLLGSKLEEVEPPKLDKYASHVQENVLPEPSKFAQAVEEKLDDAFTIGLGRLVRTGDFKSAGKAFGAALLDSILGDLTRTFAQKLSKSISNGLTGIEFPTIKFNSPSRAVGGGFTGGDDTDPDNVAAVVGGIGGAGLGLAASAGLAAGGFGATLAAVHLLNQFDLGGNAGPNTVDSVRFDPGSLFPRVEANLLQEGYTYGQTVQAQLAADIGGASWNPGSPGGLVTNRGVARDAWISAESGGAISINTDNVGPEGGLRSEEEVRALMGDRFQGFLSGGMVGGRPGEPVPAILHGSEGVLTQRGVALLGMLNRGELPQGHLGGAGNTFLFNVVLNTPDADGARRLLEGEFGDLILARIREATGRGEGVVDARGVINLPTV